MQMLNTTSSTALWMLAILVLWTHHHPLVLAAAKGGFCYYLPLKAQNSCSELWSSKWELSDAFRLIALKMMLFTRRMENDTVKKARDSCCYMSETLVPFPGVPQDTLYLVNIRYEHAYDADWSCLYNEIEHLSSSCSCFSEYHCCNISHMPLWSFEHDVSDPFGVLYS